MSADPVPADVARVDQQAAAARDEALVVASFWKTLRVSGMPDDLAAALTENYQAWRLDYNAEDEA